MTAERRDRLVGQRALALCGIAGPALFAVGVVVAGALWDGYSHRTQDISDLGGTAAPYPLVQNVSFVVLGVLVAAFAVGLRRSLGARRGAGAAAALVGCFGVAMALLAFFPCTPGCGEGTVADVVHGLAALTGFLAFIAGAFVLARPMRAHAGWASTARYATPTAVGALVALVLWFAATAVDPEQLQGGAVQRLLVGIVLVWLVAAGVRLLRLSSDRGDGG